MAMGVVVSHAVAGSTPVTLPARLAERQSRLTVDQVPRVRRFESSTWHARTSPAVELPLSFRSSAAQFDSGRRGHGHVTEWYRCALAKRVTPVRFRPWPLPARSTTEVRLSQDSFPAWSNGQDAGFLNQGWGFGSLSRDHAGPVRVRPGRLMLTLLRIV